MRAVLAGTAAFAALLSVGLVSFRPTDSVREATVSARQSEVTADDPVVADVAAPVATQTPVPQQPGEQPVSQAAPVETDPFAAIRLEGIFYRATDPSVLLNGKTLFKGESVSGARVVAITRESVTVEIAGKQKVLRLQPKP